MNSQLNIGVSRERREIWLNDPPATSASNGAPNQDDRNVVKERCKVVHFSSLLEEFFIFMEIVKLRVCLREGNLAGISGSDLFHYSAEAIEDEKRYYYRADNVTLEITQKEYAQVIRNPSLYYFSTALKLHFLIQKSKNA